MPNKYDKDIERDKYLNKIIALIFIVPGFLGFCWLAYIILPHDSLNVFIITLSAILAGTQLGSIKDIM